MNTEHDEYLKKGLSHTVTVGLFTLLASITGYGTRLFLARTISPDAFGLFYALFSLFMLITVVADLGLGVTLVKYISEHLAQKKNALVDEFGYHISGRYILFTVLCAAPLLLFYNFIAQRIFHTADAAIPVLIFGIIIILNSGVALIQQTFIAYQEMVKYGWLYFLSKASFLLLCVALFSLGVNGRLLPAWAFSLSLVLVLIIFAPLVYQRMKPWRPLEPWLKLWKPWLRAKRDIYSFAIPNFLSSISWTAIGYIDTLLLAFFGVALAEVGVYSSAMATVMVLGNIGGTVALIYLPMASELRARGKEKLLWQSAGTLHTYALIITLPLALTFAFFAPVVLRLLFGEAFVVGTAAFRILAVGVAFMASSQINFAILNGIGKPKKVLEIAFWTLAVNIALNCMLIRPMGITGAAIASATSYMLMFMWSSRAALRKSFSFRKSKIPMVVLLSLAFLGALYLLRMLIVFSSDLLRSIIVAAAAGVIYLILLFAAGVITRAEMSTLWRHIRKV